MLASFQKVEKPQLLWYNFFFVVVALSHNLIYIRGILYRLATSLLRGEQKDMEKHFGEGIVFIF